MKIDFSGKLKTLSGLIIKNEKDEDFTLAEACSNALVLSDERREARTPIEAKEFLRRYRLANRVYGAKEPIEIDAEENVLIQKALAFSGYSGLIIGQAVEMLESGETRTEPDLKIPKAK